MPQYGAQIDTLRIPIKGLIPEQSVTSSPPASPVEGLMWHDTLAKQVKVYLNGAWVQMDNVTGGTASNVSDGDKGAITVTGGVWALDANTVGSSQIVDGTIVAADLAPGTIPSALPPNGAAGGDLGGTYPNPTVLKGQNNFRAQSIISTALNPAATALQVNTPSAGDVEYKWLVTGMGNVWWGDGTAAPDTNLFRSAANMLHTNDSFTVDGTLSVGGQVDVTSHKIVNLLDPTAAQDAATKAYVDSFAQGLDPKQSVRCASTANVADLNDAGGFADGIGYVAGDRVLLKNQTAPAQNGIYVGTAGGPSIRLVRATDMDVWAEVPSAYVFVEVGTVNADTGWLCTADQGGTLGTTAIPWVQFSGAGQVVAGGGLTKTGNQLDVGAGAGITVNADTVQIANDGITNAMIADGAINLASADVTGTLPVAKGGTGATSVAGARGNIGATGYKQQAGPALTAGAWTDTGIVVQGTGFCTVSIYDSSKTMIILDYRINGTSLQVKGDIAFSAGAYTVYAVGDVLV